MGNVILIKILVLLFAIRISSGNNRTVIEVNGTPDDLVWVVQLSDLHLSVHQPQRARDFADIVGPALSFIRPSLVLLTGDLTGGFSKLHSSFWLVYQLIGCVHNWRFNYIMGIHSLDV